MHAFRAEPADRQNNLNAIRLVAALAVTVSHAWPIVHGAETVEPLSATGYTLGTIAVMVFFGLSGFLIAASWARTPEPGRFLARRARRLLPGLWVMLVLSALVMGPIVSTLSPGAFLSDPATWRFLGRNALLLPIEPALPGVFGANPYPAAAGSIWTLHYEALCYLGLMMLGLAGCLAKVRAGWWLGAVLALAVFAALAGDHLHPRLTGLVLLGLPFALGVGAWIWRQVLPLALTGVAMLAVAAWLAHGTVVYHPVFAGFVVYATLWAGFVPWSAGRRLARRSDLSYGIYLYAFPLQGLVQHLIAPGDVATHLVLAIPPTIGLATLSWYWIERPWLTGTPPLLVWRAVEMVSGRDDAKR